MQRDIFRIALIGPESTGKTTLCIQLAEYFETVWVPEYARNYMNDLKRPYTFDDVLFCTEKQLELEDELISKSNKYLFSDTEMIIAKVWLLDVFKKCPEWIENKIDENRYDLYLLTFPDLPFINDPVRENAERRFFFYDWYKSELDERKFPYKVITGLKEERFQNAIKLILQLADNK